MELKHPYSVPCDSKGLIRVFPKLTSLQYWKYIYYPFLVISSSLNAFALGQSIGHSQAVSSLLYPGRFGSVLPIECPIVTISLSTYLLQVSLGLFRPLLPCEFHLRDCLVILPLDLLNVWPIHFHFLFPISSIIGTWPTLPQRSSLLYHPILFLE